MSSAQKTADRCEALADKIEGEMPEFAKVTREAVALIRSWDD